MQGKTSKQVTLDLRVVIAVLLIAILVMLFLWRPWQTTSNDRVIEINGQATVTATPDQFVFTPSYQIKNTDKQKAITEAEQKGEQIVAELKKLGVPEQKIKTSTSSYDLPLRDGVTDETTYTLGLTVTVDNQELAQKVQDYLASTSPVGSVSPQSYFSDDKKKELESQAREIAIEDAREKAEQAAEDLGFSVGKVKKVSDGFAFGVSGSPELTIAQDTTPKLSLHSGENEVTYTMYVSFYLR